MGSAKQYYIKDLVFNKHDKKHLDVKAMTVGRRIGLERLDRVDKCSIRIEVTTIYHL